MIQDQIDQRKRGASEALTCDSSRKPQALPMSLRPTKDPDFPPKLELEANFNQQNAYQQLSLAQKLQALQIGQGARFRKRSQQGGLTILDFLSNKIRSRVKSEEIHQVQSFF